MKILSSKKQIKVMDLIYKAQMYAREDNFIKITDCLADIAGEVLTLGQLCFLKDAICKGEKKW